METLRERISMEREEVSKRTFKGQREFDDSNKVLDLTDKVETLTSQVNDLEHRCNYHEPELNELNAAVNLIIDAVEGLNVGALNGAIDNLAKRLVRDEELIGIDDESDHHLGHGRVIVGILNNVVRRLVRDEELIGIDEESEHWLADDLTVVDELRHHQTAIDDFDEEFAATMKLHELAYDQKLEALQDQINAKMPK